MESSKLWDNVCFFENLLSAYYRARKPARYKKSAMEFDFNLEQNLFKLSWELSTGRYKPSAYKYFTVHDPKERDIAAPNFRDRVVHHSLVAQIEPLFEKQFIYDSYACRKDRGTHFAQKRLKKFLMAVRCIYGGDTPVYPPSQKTKSVSSGMNAKKFLLRRDFAPDEAEGRRYPDRQIGELHILQADIKKYFQNINWDILLGIIRKTVKCQDAMKLIKKIVETHQGYCVNGMTGLNPVNKAGVSIKERKGLPIGNLTSQLFANVYLNELDHFVKEKLRLRFYGRYMDDFFIIYPDREYLKKVKGEIENFLREKLKLELHPKKVIIYNTKYGVPFVGYRIFYDHILVRGKTLLRMQKKLKKKRKMLKKGKITAEKLMQTRNSYEGHLKHANAYKLTKTLFKEKAIDSFQDSHVKPK